jgi:hypothetical protein
LPVNMIMLSAHETELLGLPEVGSTGPPVTAGAALSQKRYREAATQWKVKVVCHMGLELMRLGAMMRAEQAVLCG